jgi:predicted phage tail protein
MKDAKRFAALYPLGNEFDNCLFATIGEDQNGLLLSVNSALARLNVDPWDEATALMQLPHDTAARRLATSIERLPCMPSAWDPAQIAERLIALLPRGVRTTVGVRPLLDGAKSMVKSVSGAYFIVAILFVVSVFTVLWLNSKSVGAAVGGETATTAVSAFPSR